MKYKVKRSAIMDFADLKGGGNNEKMRNYSE